MKPFIWSHGRTENRCAPFGRFALFLAGAPPRVDPLKRDGVNMRDCHEVPNRGGRLVRIIGTGEGRDARAAGGNHDGLVRCDSPLLHAQARHDMRKGSVGAVHWMALYRSRIIGFGHSSPLCHSSNFKLSAVAAAMLQAASEAFTACSTRQDVKAIQMATMTIPTTFKAFMATPSRYSHKLPPDPRSTRERPLERCYLMPDFSISRPSSVRAGRSKAGGYLVRLHIFLDLIDCYFCWRRERTKSQIKLIRYHVPVFRILVICLRIISIILPFFALQNFVHQLLVIRDSLFQIIQRLLYAFGCKGRRNKTI